MRQSVVISGCSGGGKSALLAEVSSSGYALFEDPSRPNVKEQLTCAGDGLPWLDEGGIAELCADFVSMHRSPTARGLPQSSVRR